MVRIYINSHFHAFSQCIMRCKAMEKHEKILCYWKKKLHDAFQDYYVYLKDMKLKI